MPMICNARDFDHAIHALDAYLRDRDYTRRSRQGIAIHVRATGTLEGTVPEFLDREDLETATETLVAAFEPVSFGSPEWGEDDGRWTPHDVFRLEPPELEEFELPEPTPAPTPAAPVWTDGDYWIVDPETGEVHERPEPEAPDESAASGESYWAAMMADGVMPLPVCGGAPDHFEPSEADLQDYADWQDEIAAQRHWARQRDRNRAWYAVHGDDEDRPMGAGMTPA